MRGLTVFETYDPKRELTALVKLGEGLARPFLVITPIDGPPQLIYKSKEFMSLKDPRGVGWAEFLKGVLAGSGFDYLIRVFPFYNDLPLDLPRKVEARFLETGTFSQALGEEIGLCFAVECFGPDGIGQAESAGQLYLPGLQLNVPCAASGRVWLDRSLREHFFRAGFERHYGLPASVSFELANACNIRCVKCPFHSPEAVYVPASEWGDQPKFADAGVVLGGIEQAASWPRKPTIFLCGDGEPLLHANILEFVDKASALGLPVTLTSNGVLLEGKTAERLARARVNVCVSLDAIDAKTYQSITGKDHFQRVSANLSSYKEAVGVGATVIVAYVDMPRFNAGQFPAFRDHWAAKGLIVKKINEIDLFDHSKHHYYDIGLPRIPFPCNQPFLNLRVLSDGVVAPCCVTYPRDFSLGDARTTPLLDIWRGPGFRAFREAFFASPFMPRHCIRRKCWMWSTSARIKRSSGNMLETTYVDFIEYQRL